jgi:16S rRNA (adenine1518-N6/adenine1519-N6)-dimethyltransferase
MSTRPCLPPPRKRLGQHFLTDKNILRKIITLADLQPEETVLEIGPGLGSLTNLLCQFASRTIAVEIDSTLVDFLKQEYAHISTLEVIGQDALKFPYETLPKNTVIVANLPYNISTPLLFRLFEARDRITRMVLTLQLEVARRLVAGTGTREYGVLSVLTQNYANTRLAFQIPRACFRPPPDVTSAVVRLDVKINPHVPREENEWFVRTVRAAFAHRRKTLLNAMRDEGLEPSIVQQALNGVDIDGRRRAETLSLQEFRDLSLSLQRIGGCFKNPPVPPLIKRVRRGFTSGIGVKKP